MLVALVIMLVTLPHGYWLYAVIAGMALGNLWIWSRPDRSPEASLSAVSPCPSSSDACPRNERT